MSFQAAVRAKSEFFPRVSALALLAGLTVLAGCGSSSTTTSSSATAPSSAASSTAAPAGSAASGALTLAADAEGQLKFDSSALTAKAGKVSIAFTNSSALAHNVTIASSSGAVLGATPTFQGGSKTVALSLKPGSYKFYCSVPGHRQAGMEGTLTVQ